MILYTLAYIVKKINIISRISIDNILLRVYNAKYQR
nr:MAG TPA: hypothetical protein [Caudoviricetes sp.]DAV57647.1 MAG TPA: hypothetical protein [Caudoviricetes sp.]